MNCKQTCGSLKRPTTKKATTFAILYYNELYRINQNDNDKHIACHVKSFIDQNVTSVFKQPKACESTDE